MRRFELEENERKILHTLAQRGAMSPSQVSAATWMLPGETLNLLRGLSSEGFILMRGDTNSPDGMLVAITTEARQLITRLNGIAR